MKRKKNDRGFREIPLQPVGCQRNGSRPLLVPWAINLAVLSEQNNLYIIAAGAVLELHSPAVPSQGVRQDAAIHFALHKTHENLQGHLSPENPHAATNIIIGRLGNVEIVLCACDDGDIVGYETSKLMKYAEACRYVWC